MIPVTLSIERSGKIHEYQLDLPQVPSIGELIATTDVASARVADVKWSIDEEGTARAWVWAS